MYDSGKIILGIIIFLGLFTCPIWFNIASGKAEIKPNIVLPAKEDQEKCINSAEYMRLLHMDLLNDWRDKVVRENERFILINGKKYEMSLTKTCMDCHSNKTEFCDQCHNYLGVTPYCWDCHVEPQKMEIE
ncbi:sulfate reduction electron transfer complex DsrMKJOP subunit DsrJ [Bacteroidota bacterium]